MTEQTKKQNAGTRLHKYSPLFILIAAIKQTIVPLIIGGGYYRMSDKTEYFIIAVSIIGALFPLLTFWFYHYWIKDDVLEIKEGIFFKKNRKIPFTRIQNVNVLQGPLQRLFKVATLQLESASGGRPEAIMRVVDLSVVDEIKEKVRLAGHDATQKNESVIEKTTQETSKPLLTLNTKEVIKYGIISQKGLVIGGIIFAFMAQNQQFMENSVKYFGLFFHMPDFTKITLQQSLVYVSVIGIVIFIVLQLLSIIWALLRFYRFEITKQQNRLLASMGLLAKVSATIPLKRIQLYRLNSNPIHRFFKAKTISIETAGGVNTAKAGIVMRWLAPYIACQKIPHFMRQIEDKINYDKIQWQLIPARAWKRVMKRALIQLAIFSTVLILISGIPGMKVRFYAWIVIACLFPLTYVYAKKNVKNTAYFVNEDIIAFKSGIWFKKQSIVKINKIQTVEIIETFFDRRNKMARLEIDTAGSNPMLHHVLIPYLAINDVYQIRKFLVNQIEKSQLAW